VICSAPTLRSVYIITCLCCNVQADLQTPQTGTCFFTRQKNRKLTRLNVLVRLQMRTFLSEQWTAFTLPRETHKATHLVSR
jgi:hypothetical protein